MAIAIRRVHPSFVGEVSGIGEKVLAQLRPLVTL